MQDASEAAARHDVAVVVVSHKSAAWLAPCLDSLRRHAGEAMLEILVVENGGTDESREVVLRDDAGARWMAVPNLGFANALNVGVASTEAPYVLLLNPDTEIVAGTLDVLVEELHSHPDVALLGVRQVWPDGGLQYTIRRFPSVVRWLGESLGSESWPVRSSRFGERELSPAAYERPGRCDWTAGSFMLARRSALDAVGGFDEDYFLYCEEPDLCLRLRRVGWSVQHRPELTVVHHGGNESSDPRHAAQLAYAKRIYMRKHFSAPRRLGGLAALAVGYGIRAVVGGRDDEGRVGQRANARAALATLVGLRDRPFRPAAPAPDSCATA
jgi:GT2 family glycosyltransferase